MFQCSSFYTGSFYWFQNLSGFAGNCQWPIFVILPVIDDSSLTTRKHTDHISENVPSNTRKMRRLGSSCPCAKYHPGLCSPFMHSVVSNDSVSGQERPWSACADAQADLGLCCPHMPEEYFCMGRPILIIIKKTVWMDGIETHNGFYGKTWSYFIFVVIGFPTVTTMLL